LAADLTPAHRAPTARRIAERLAGAVSVAVATHVNGDGDGWGSACALAHQLAPLGVGVTLLAATPYPQRFRFLLPDGLEPMGPDARGKEALSAADLLVVVDACESGRLGDFAETYRPERTIVIDHHAVASTPMQAALSFIDPQAAATAELVFDVIAASAEELNVAAARALYVGLVTDTGSFRYSNSSPHAHRLAARLIESGAEPEALYRPLFGNVSRAELETLRAALARLEHDAELGLTWTKLEAELIQRYGRLEEYESIIEHLRNLENTEVAVFFRELDQRLVKISLRSSGPVDVARIAAAFGGGGHEKAAGAVVEGGLAGVSQKVLAACREALRQRQA